MLQEDKTIMDLLLKDKGKRYRVVVDNDSVWVEDKENENKPIHDFGEYSYYLLVQIFEYLGLDAEHC